MHAIKDEQNKIQQKPSSLEEKKKELKTVEEEL